MALTKFNRRSTAGGMVEVYRARDTRLDRIVAIKVLPHHLTSDLKQRFEHEVRSVSALNHPRICTLYDVGYQGRHRLPGHGVP